MRVIRMLVVVLFAGLVLVPGVPMSAAATGTPHTASALVASSLSSATSTSPSAPATPTSPAKGKTTPKPSPTQSQEPKGGGWTIGIVLLAILVVGSLAWWVAQLRSPRR